MVAVHSLPTADVEPIPGSFFAGCVKGARLRGGDTLLLLPCRFTRVRQAVCWRLFRDMLQ
jgi:hypothetical protein